MPTRALELPPPDVYQPLCPSRGVLDHVTTRWAVLVLIALREEMHRFSALRRKVGGVSEKMLAQTLAVLEEDGFVQRTAYPEVPPRVEYRLTPLGSEVSKHIERLVGWIEASLPEVLKARASHHASRALMGKSRRTPTRLPERRPR
jgi:DNA-binding HxlR family transcriptional regulator